MFNVVMKSWGLCGEAFEIDCFKVGWFVCVWSEPGSEVWHVNMLTQP